MKKIKKPSHEEATLIKSPEDFDKTTVGKDSDSYPLLEIQVGPKRQGEWYTLVGQKEVTIGRATVNTIVLEDNSVSRTHALVHESEGQYLIKDVGSRNGTAVNNKRIQEDHPLKQGDTIKVGIYTLKFLTEPEEDTPIGEEEEVDFDKLEQELVQKAQEQEEKKHQEMVKAEQAEASLAGAGASSLPPSLVSGAPSFPKPPSPPGKAAGLITLLVLIGILAGGGFLLYRYVLKDRWPFASNSSKPSPSPEPKISPVVIKPSPSAPPASSPGQGVPIFLEVDAQPLQAKIFYQGKELGVTPFRINIHVPSGSPQELTAVYHFNELNQDFSEKKSFTVSKQEEVVTVKFEGGVGSFLVKSLPKNVQVYLEGTFASNTVKAQAVKLNDIQYTRPIYLPYGNYIVELKRPEKLEGSDTVVDTVKYRREFTVKQDSPTYEIALKDEDLTVFPAKIKTTPPGASVLVNGKKYGETTFEGNLPLGKGKLALRKEGYFDHEQDLSMTMNTPFALEATLKTSEAGQYINQGRSLMRQEQFKQAIDQLSEALKHRPSPAEIAQIQILLGNCYLKTGSNDIALGYFEKAASHPNYKGKASLGIVEANLNLGNKDVALTRVIDLMINEKDEEVKGSAEDLFHKISPLKGVLLISTDPPGAKVWLNNQQIAQQTPVLLSELLIGSYRIAIEKEGYKRFETRLQLTLSSFKPVIVKLEPIK